MVSSRVLTVYDLILDSFLFLFISMIIVAASLYLPQHIMEIASRAWFYYAGDEGVRRVGGKWDVVASGTGVGAVSMTRAVGEL
jgi:hypothetical protein